MSNLINKVKDALHSDKKSDDPRSDNYGPHSSNMANSADPRVDSDMDGRHNPAGGHGHGHTTTGGHAGTGLGSTVHSSTTTAGPHSSNLANKADPRVDSDLDGRNTFGSSTTGGYGSNTVGHGAPTTGGYGSNTVGDYGSTTGGPGGYGTHAGSTNAGPHSSNMANKVDPRVDSDRDHRNDPTSTYGSSTSGGAYTGSTASGSTNAGPHSSNFANKIDPRVDSDYDNRNDPTSRVGGYGGQQGYGAGGANPMPSGGQQHHSAGTTGGYGGVNPTHSQGGVHHSAGTTGGYGGADQTGYAQDTTGNYGQSGYGNQGAGVHDSSYTPGSGNAQQTAGPHNSNLLNKIDPRVDSDMDGSKTYGGNQTHR